MLSEFHVHPIYGEYYSYAVRTIGLGRERGSRDVVVTVRVMLDNEESLHLAENYRHRTAIPTTRGPYPVAGLLGPDGIGSRTLTMKTGFQSPQELEKSPPQSWKHAEGRLKPDVVGPRPEQTR